ncbi:AsnC family transcriptional regulator [Psychromonas sp. MB-3u-54]|uniref:Lrp/AsnC family transcriptional regulator n=1 Tax=Psychromonas sp. MB-3u-54 TaxID=2058319 RepID=UPI000C3264FB|nr:Lrp/AsnC family transcriptional regulator [Psychromonas sp. MB-3u-54]PKH02130.1 AsnC family transcriptional regulator [Psychromonas sp. MB-3u-54]
MDKIDQHMLMILQQEGRISTADLSEKVALSPSPCARRLKRLEEEGYIENYQANLNKAKIGIVMTFFVEIRLNDHQAASIDDFEKIIAEMKEVINGYIVSGAYDYLLEVVSPDLEGYELFTKKLHRLKSVRDIHTHLSVRQIKAQSSLPVFK